MMAVILMQIMTWINISKIILSVIKLIKIFVLNKEMVEK